MAIIMYMSTDLWTLLWQLSTGIRGLWRPSVHIDVPRKLSLTHWPIDSLTHSLTHAWTHSRPRSLTRSLTHSLPHSFTYLLCCIHSLTHSLTRWTHSLTYIHSLAHTHFYSDPNAYTCIGNLYMCICMAVTHSLTHSLTQSLTHPFTHSLTHSLTRASHCTSSRTPCGRQHYWSRTYFMSAPSV